MSTTVIWQKYVSLDQTHDRFYGLKNLFVEFDNILADACLIIQFHYFLERFTFDIV